MRIDAALEAVGGLRTHLQPLRSAANTHAVEVCHLDEHRGSPIRDLCIGATHDTRQRDRPRSVTDDQVALHELARAAIKRLEQFAGQCCPDHHLAALQFSKVKGMERLPLLKQNIVGEIDQVAHRSLAHSLQPPLHPERRGRHLHPVGDDGGVTAAAFGVGHLDSRKRGSRSARHRQHRRGGGCAEAPAHAGRDLFREPDDAQAVGPVRRHGEFKDEVVKPHRGREGRTDHERLVEQHQAAMIIAQPKLLGGAEHAMRRDTADGCRLNLQTVRNAGTRECERHNAAGRSVGRTADNLPQRAAAVVHLADLKFVGAGVRCSLHNAGHNNEF